MSRRHKDKGRIQGQYTTIRYEILDSAAWKQMSMGARMLYIALTKPLSFTRDNNGKIYLSTRDAAKQLNASPDSICFWYRELEHYGFIEMTKPGTIGPNGTATRWRITDVGWGVLDGKSIEATKDYLKWTGEVFNRVRPKTENHPTEPHRVCGPTVHRGVRANRTPRVPSVRANRTEARPPNDRSNRTELDQPLPPSGTRSAPPQSAVASVPPKPVELEAAQRDIARPPLPRPPRTPEQQSRIDAQVEGARRHFGLRHRGGGRGGR
jgi:hypothetical protein